MLRNLLCCVAVLFILAFTAAPAFAYTTGTPVYYAPITFDSLRTGSSYQISSAWDFNRVSQINQDIVFPTYEVHASVGSYSQTDGYAWSTFEVYGASSGFQLHGSDQIVTLSLLSSFEIYFGIDGDMQGRVSYSGELMMPGRSGDAYVLDSYLIGGSRDSTGYLNVGQMIATDISEYTNEPYAYIRNLVITVTWADDTVDPPVYDIRMHYYQAPQIQVTDWFDRQRLEHTTVVSINPGEETFNPVAWLDNILQAFFDFELMPGISVRGLFAIGIAIGILLLFLKIVQAG